MTAVVLQRRMSTGLAIGRLLPAYIVFAILKHVVPLPALARLAWRDPVTVRDPEHERLTIARIVRTRKLFPIWDGDCVQKSLLLYRELSSGGADPVLAVGFRMTAGRVEGHAWIVVDGIAIGDGAGAAGEFTPCFCFGRRGGLIRNPVV